MLERIIRIGRTPILGRLASRHCTRCDLSRQLSVCRHLLSESLLPVETAAEMTCTDVRLFRVMITAGHLRAVNVEGRQYISGRMLLSLLTDAESRTAGGGRILPLTPLDMIRAGGVDAAWEKERNNRNEKDDNEKE